MSIGIATMGMFSRAGGETIMVENIDVNASISDIGIDIDIEDIDIDIDIEDIDIDIGIDEEINITVEVE